MTLQEKNILQYGGLSGILGSIVFILVFFIVGIFVGTDPIILEEFVTRFDGIRLARIFENSLYLSVLVLWIPSSLALYHALKAESPASALFGSVVSIAGLAVIAVGALPHVAFHQLHNLYYSATATVADQATIVLLWQTTWAIFDAVLIAGLAFMPLAFLSFGIAMRKHTDFGAIYGWLVIALSIISFGAISVSLVDPDSVIVALIIFGLIIFHFALGWKLYRLSRQ